MRYNFQYRKYERVEAGTTFEEILTPCENCTMEIAQISGTAPYNSSCHVEILFGDDIIFTTHGDKTDNTGMMLHGSDGKSLTLRMINNSLTTETMGLSIIGNKSE
mgnify:CR=1 FL=1